ncbi:hypothetical protein B7R22_05245 [Subtercola boreus]|uniref:Alpha-amylase n=1 Tax=Subtercola boreus TaxID=120213 RepID=A0A3E0W1H5_9MICO|nr:hypothetical protein B7R22_05245 [Subtercola boreus]
MAAMLVVAASIGFVPAAQADDSPTVSGTVTDPSGTVVPGSTVIAQSVCLFSECEDYRTYATTVTDAAGFYRVGLKEDEYIRLLVQPPSSASAPLAVSTVYLPNSSHPTSIVRDVQLSPGLVPTTNPSLQGACQYAKTLTVDLGAWPVNISASYRWSTYGHNQGSDTSWTQSVAGGQSVVVPISSRAEFGFIYRDLKLDLTISAPGYGDYMTVLSCAPTVQPSYVATAPPVISGDPSVGQYLTADPGVWTDSPTNFTYRWFAGTKYVGTSTNGRKLVTPLAVGQVMTVSVLPVSGEERAASSPSVSAPTTTVALGPAPVPVKAPSISGAPRVGGTLKIDQGFWNLPDYQTPICSWFRDGMPDGPSGACNTVRTLSAADYGHRYLVQVRMTRTGYLPAVVSTKEVTVLAGLPAVNSVLPKINGTAQVGRILVATSGTWDRPGVAFDYQWLADGKAIVGETSPSHPVTAADAGKKLSIRVTATTPGYTPSSAVSLSTATTIKMAAPVNTVRPTVTGTAQVGATLSVSSGTWSQSGLTYAYQWYANGTSIAGATKPTYAVDGSMLGQKLSVRVSATSASYADASATSLATAVVSVGPRPVIATPPTLSGGAQVGQVLKTTSGTWSTGGLTFAYAWYRDGVVISGATGSTHSVVAADMGHRIMAQVTASKLGYNTATAKSAASATVLDAPPTIETKPTISGTASVDRALTAAPGAWSRTGLTFAYTWTYEGSTTVLGSGASYVLAPADYGKKITVTVTASAAGSASGVATSLSTTAVAAGAAPTFTVAPVITGKTIVGQTLTTTHGSWSSGGLTYTYQWTRNGGAISGATKTTYVLTKADQGTKIGMTVTVLKTGYSKGTATAAPTATITAK